MFERYTEKARRTIFFARYEASQFGGSYIETEHLLLGLLREDKALANQFLGSFAKIEALRDSIARRGQAGPKIATSVELPLSQECKRALAYGAEESERMNHKFIDTPHLLLGLLREEKSFAAQLLHEHGLSLGSLRDQVRRSEPPPVQAASMSIDRLREWLAERQARGGAWTIEQHNIGRGTTDFAIYAGNPPQEDETHQAAQRVPLLCIDIIRDERFWEVLKRCQDYMDAGVAQVWILDANSKRAYTVTKTEGLREFKGEILRMANPPLEMDLRKIFD